MQATLDEYGLPASAPEEQLRAVTRVAATLCGTPTAVVNLLGGCFQHQVGAVGFEGADSPLGESMCQRAVRDPGLRYAPDARLMPAFASNPWVDGRRAAVRLYASAPLVLPDGRVLGTLCVFAEEAGELTEAQRAGLADLAGQVVSLFEHARLTRESEAAREALRLSEEQHRLLFDAAPVGMVEADRNGVILRANAALAALLGHDAPSALVGRPLPDLTHASERSEQEDLLARALRGELDAWDSDRRMIRRDGGVVHTVIAKRVLRGTDGTVHRLLASTVDVSERTAARRALESANEALHDQAEQIAQARDEALAATRAKSSFLAAVSHEIRTPLHGVLGMLELLLQDELDEVQRERAGIALTAGRTLLGLLNDVLDLSKDEAREVRLRPRPTDCGRLVRDVADAVRGTAQLKGVDVRVQVDAALPPLVLLDPDRLRQVLLNLAGNAVKFTDTGAVVLRARIGPDGQLACSVTDTGPGLDPADLERIFEPFEQAAQGRHKGGTGLGLALSRQLTELMGGTLTVSGPGPGATFTATLPLEVPVGVDGRDVPPVPAQTLDRELPVAPRVLLVDDNEVNLLVGAALLRRLGAQVTVAEGGHAAVEQATRTRFDIVLMDRHMPGMDGVAATRALRGDPVTARVPIIALTGDGDESRQECLDAGMDDYLTKPIALDQLRELIQRFVPRPRATPG